MYIAIPAIITGSSPDQVSGLVTRYCAGNTNVFRKSTIEDLHRVDAHTKTLSHFKAPMKSSQLQASLLYLLAKLMNAKSIVEIGTFTGYTATALAAALPNDGESKLITYDIDPQVVSFAKGIWSKHGTKIDSRIGDILEDFRNHRFQEGSVDMIFIDAGNKDCYKEYYEMALKILRPGGIVVIDNSLWTGSVITPIPFIPYSRELNDLNRSLAKDERVEVVQLPLFDGLTIARKKTSLAA